VRLIAVLVLVNACAVASASEGHLLYLLEQEDIDMARTSQYEDGVRRIVAAATHAKLGSEFTWQTSQHGSTYYYLSRVRSSRAFDPRAVEKQTLSNRLASAIEWGSYQRFLTLTEPAVRHRQVQVLEHAPEFDYTPKAAVADPQFNYVDIVQVHAARITEFNRATRETIAALGAAGYPIGFTTYRVLVGGPDPNAGPSYRLISPYESRSQFYEAHPLVGAVQRALGSAAALELLAGQQRNLVSGQSFDHIRRPDLGYGAGAGP
jgi:hypothetical protein